MPTTTASLLHIVLFLQVWLVSLTNVIHSNSPGQIHKGTPEDQKRKPIKSSVEIQSYCEARLSTATTYQSGVQFRFFYFFVDVIHVCLMNLKARPVKAENSFGLRGFEFEFKVKVAVWTFK